MKNKLLKILLTCIMIVILVASLSGCAIIFGSEIDGNSLMYHNNGDGTCSVEACNMYIFGHAFLSEDIIIPEYSPSGLKVTEIDDRGFYRIDKMKSITLPSTIEKIGYGAFAVNRNLEKIVIPEGVTAIGEAAFQFCSNLENVDLPNSLRSIGAYAFQYCMNLDDIILPDGLARVKQGAFMDCYSLQSLNIPNSLKQIDISSFWGVNEIILSDNATEVPDNAFSGAGNRSIIIPDSVTKIGKKAFSNCDNISSITIPEGVTSIGDGAFSDCQHLVSVTVPKSVTSIGNEAFSYNHKMIEIINHSSVQITADEKCMVHNGESIISNVGDYLFYTCDGVNYLLGYVRDDDRLTLPESYNGENYEIYRGAFSDFSHIISVTIPQCVTKIGDNAFYQCFKLVEIINRSEVEIKTGGNSMHEPGTFAIEIHSGESKIVEQDEYLFYTYGKNYLIGNTGEGGDLILPESYDGEAYDIYNYAFYRRTDITNVVIPNCISRIGDSAFSYCVNIKDLAIPNGVTDIGSSAFYHCYNIKELSLGNNLSSIESRAFGACNLKVLVIPDSVTSIGENAFSYCSDLESIYIGKGAINISAGAFSANTRLESIEVDQRNKNYKSIDGNLYSKDGTVLMQYALGKDADEFSVPQGVKRIEYYAFAHSLLKNVILPEGLESIGQAAFMRCEELKSINIPSSVTSIESSAFLDCDSLNSVTFANPNGWNDWNNESSYEYFRDPQKAAKYLKDGHPEHYKN